MLDLLQVQDVWTCAFSPSASCNDHHVAKGRTWGFHTAETREPEKSPAGRHSKLEDPPPPRHTASA